jgi:general stress protein 26
MKASSESQTMKKVASHPTNEEAEKRLLEIMKSHGDVMFFNHDVDGALCGRPMQAVRIDDDGTSYFATGVDSEKVADLRLDPEVTLSFQGGREYALVTGEARISQDRALIDQLWSDAWKTWFPDGKEDPSIAVIIVDPDTGTYWDNTKTQGLSFLLRAAKARLIGERIERAPGDSATVAMNKKRGARL